MRKHVLFFRYKDYNIWWHYSKLNKLIFGLLYALIIGWYAFIIGFIVGIFTECIIKKDYKIPRPASEYITFARVLSIAVNGKLNHRQQFYIQQVVKEFFPTIQVSAFWFNFYDQVKVKNMSKYVIAQWTTYLAYSNYKIEEALQTIIDYDSSGKSPIQFIEYWNEQLGISLTNKQEANQKEENRHKEAYTKQVEIDLNTLGIIGKFPSTKTELKKMYVNRLKEVHPDTAKQRVENIGEYLKEIKAAYLRLNTLIQNG